MPIANLTHGQMQAMAKWRGPILALADQVLWPDRDLRRLLQREGNQHFWCAFGMMPRSVEDEASPFNECTHAYLATDREILLQIVKAGDRVEDARILKERISLDMLADADALMGCQYSAESFNTASTVYPDPLGIPFHAPTALTIFALVLGIWGLVQGIRVVERRIEASPTAPTATMRDGSPV